MRRLALLILLVFSGHFSHAETVESTYLQRVNVSIQKQWRSELLANLGSVDKAEMRVEIEIVPPGTVQAMKFSEAKTEAQKSLKQFSIEAIRKAPIPKMSGLLQGKYSRQKPMILTMNLKVVYDKE